MKAFIINDSRHPETLFYYKFLRKYLPIAGRILIDLTRVISPVSVPIFPSQIHFVYLNFSKNKVGNFA